MINQFLFSSWNFCKETALLKERGEKQNKPAVVLNLLLVGSTAVRLQQVLHLLCFRCACVDARHAQKASRKWTLEMDVALVQYINRLCRHLAITPARLHPHEVYLDPADAADPRISCLLSMCGWFA